MPLRRKFHNSVEAKGALRRSTHGLEEETGEAKPWDEKVPCATPSHTFRRPREDHAREEEEGKTAGVQTMS